MGKERHRHKSAEDRPASTDVKDAHHLTDEEYEQAVRTSKGLSAVQKKDIKARIIARYQKGDQIEVVIASGVQQGVEDGMEGVFPNEERPECRFRVFGVEDRICRAYLALPNHDMITRDPYVVVNPSSKR